MSIHEDDDDERRVAPKRKNTKRWCKGKTGREHEYEWTTKTSYPFNYQVLVCLNCGKIKDYKFGHHLES